MVDANVDRTKMEGRFFEAVIYGLNSDIWLKAGILG